MSGEGGHPAATVRGRPRTGAGLVAVVLKRTDFRESSRIVTCLSREHGRISGLAKGAHRGDSTFLGRLDFLNEIRATLSADRGGLRLLLRAELVCERRALREPARFLAASHLAQLCDFAMPDQPEPAVYDLLVGGLNLIERCPTAAISQIVLGLELRYLELLGALPDLRHCCHCGGELPGGAYCNEDSPGLACRAHATLPRRAVSASVLGLLRTLHTTAGRQWPHLEPPISPRLAAALPALWLHRATEQQSRLRHLVFART